MKFIIFSSFIFLSACTSRPVTSDSHQDSVHACSVGLDSIVSRHQPQSAPSFFFKPVGRWSQTQKNIGYAGFNEKTGENKNLIFNLKTGEEIQIPGTVDPIGLFNEDLVSIPIDNAELKTGIQFFDLRELFKNKLKSKSLTAIDLTQHGRYQSIGVLKRTKNELKIRVITDGHDGGDFRDYQVFISSKKIQLKPLTPTRPLCQNLRQKKFEFKLPMISKECAFFSSFNVNEQRMNIYRLNEKNGDCTLVDSPSLGPNDIGKLDFSPDSTQVAFHFSDRTLDKQSLAFGVPEQDWQLRSAVYDLKSKKYFLLPFMGPKTNTFYPAFLPNGNILVLVQSYTVENKIKTEFVEIDPHHLRGISQATLLKTMNDTAEHFHLYQVLSEQWMRDCLNHPNFSMRYNRMFMLLNLNPEQCLRLVSESESSLSHEEQVSAKGFCGGL